MPLPNDEMLYRCCVLITPSCLKVTKMAAREFTLESVKQFIVSSGGKVKNHELVTHFKSFLNDQSRKGNEKLPVMLLQQTYKSTALQPKFKSGNVKMKQILKQRINRKKDRP